MKGCEQNPSMQCTVPVILVMQICKLASRKSISISFPLANSVVSSAKRIDFKLELFGRQFTYIRKRSAERAKDREREKEIGQKHTVGVREREKRK